jgi:hypothetical protein
MYALTATPDQLSGIGAYIAREWGDYGYRIEAMESPTRAITVAHVVASDGSRFMVAGDRYGQCQQVSSIDKDEETFSEILAMHARATAL